MLSDAIFTYVHEQTVLQYTLISHFATIFRAMNLCHELEKFPSRITPAYEPVFKPSRVAPHELAVEMVQYRLRAVTPGFGAHMYDANPEFGVSGAEIYGTKPPNIY